MAKVSIIPWIVKKMKKCLGIAEDTNTASRSIASGNYVIWKGDAYKASSAISEGDTLSSSNLEAVTDGVGNDLKQAIANKTANTNTNITDTSFTGSIKARKFGDVVSLRFLEFRASADFSKNGVILTGYRPSEANRILLSDGYGNITYLVYVDSTGMIDVTVKTASATGYGTLTYVIE